MSDEGNQINKEDEGITNDLSALEIPEHQPLPITDDSVKPEDGIPTDSETPVEEQQIEEKEEVLVLKNQTFTIKYPPVIKTGQKPKRPLHIDNSLTLLPVGVEELNFLTERYPVSEEYKTDDYQLWLEHVVKGTENYAYGKSWDDTINREGADWNQTIDSDVGPLALGRPVFSNNDGPLLKGWRATQKMSAMLNLGQLMSVPIWHTGLWVKFRPPSDAALLELERRIAEDKVLLGRETNGMAFSNVSVYINNYLINLALTCIYEVNYVKFNSPEDILKRIKITDLQSIVWGFLCTIYPNGYPLAQPCVNNPETCQHIERETVAISKLMWTDKSGLTPRQIKHMTNRDKLLTDEEIDRYHDDMVHGGDKLVKITDNLSILFSVPTLAEYIESGYKWIDGIEDMVTGSFARSKQGDERNAYIKAISETMVLRQFSHWIKELHGNETPDNPDNGFVINDRDTIEDLMSVYSKDDTLVEKITMAVSDYMGGSTLSVVGIPRYNCPKCGEDQGKHLSSERYIIPLDIIKIFFTLLSQRLSRVTYSMNE